MQGIEKYVLNHSPTENVNDCLELFTKAYKMRQYMQMPSIQCYKGAFEDVKLYISLLRLENYVGGEAHGI